MADASHQPFQISPSIPQSPHPLHVIAAGSVDPDLRPISLERRTHNGVILTGRFIPGNHTNVTENHSRGIAILDALAAICIDRPKGQVVAVGAQTLHVTSTELSSEVQKDHKKEAPEINWREWVKDSPGKKVTASGASICLELKCLILQHGISKVRSRMLKRLVMAARCQKEFEVLEKREAENRDSGGKEPMERKRIFAMLNKILKITFSMAPRVHACWQAHKSGNDSPKKLMEDLVIMIERVNALYYQIHKDPERRKFKITECVENAISGPNVFDLDSKQDGEDNKNVEIKDDLAVRLAYRLLSDSSSRSGGDEFRSGPFQEELLAENLRESLSWADWK
ncbi:hypothetical protein DFH27DRAFT_656824 [Peziza echinospora]|nr:hypothetical protein DFH27DRAFT_656824 [Peziza echinospora]